MRGILPLAKCCFKAFGSVSIAADTGLWPTPFPDEMLFDVCLDGGIEGLDQLIMLCYGGGREWWEEEVRRRREADKAKEEGHVK